MVIDPTIAERPGWPNINLTWIKPALATALRIEPSPHKRSEEPPQPTNRRMG